MPLEVFYSYSHKDQDLRKKLETHLSLLARGGLIIAWHDRQIGAGEEWRDEIDAHMISPDFLASEYCYGIEMKTALERHAREHAIVIPIILRPVDWSGAPFRPTTKPRRACKTCACGRSMSLFHSAPRAGPNR